MIDWTSAFSLLGLGSLVMALILLGLLSKRLALVTKTPPQYRWFYVAAFFVTIGVMIRLINLTNSVASPDNLHHNNNIGWVLLYNGAPALGITLGVVGAWRYWSWLLAERG